MLWTVLALGGLAFCFLGVRCNTLLARPGMAAESWVNWSRTRKAGEAVGTHFNFMAAAWDVSREVSTGQVAEHNESVLVHLVHNE